MKKQLFLVPVLLISLSSCTSSFENKNEGLIDQENMNIVSEINELAIDTFLKNSNKSLSDVVIENENKIDQNFTPKAKSDVKEDIIKNLEKYIDQDPKAHWVYDNLSLIHI